MDVEANTTPVHQDDADEDDENVKQLQQCSSIYLSLQDCLVNSNRNWKACQKEVQALKACNERRQQQSVKMNTTQTVETTGNHSGGTKDIANNKI